ncbi:MAG TPA: Trm112 family protein [Armatimonadota bacterium]|nr:Trm112 family protein [Armatimonadota bacterium]
MDAELLEILACPECKASVEQEPERLVCTACGRRYPIRDGIPIMLVEEAEPPASGWKPKQK